MLSQEASAVVASFGQQPGVTREHLDNFNRVLNDSPELTRQINEAVQKKGAERLRAVKRSACGRHL